MEPQAVRVLGGAPIVGWSQPSASMASVLDSPRSHASSGIASDSTVTEELSSCVLTEKNNNGHVVTEVKFNVPHKDDDSMVTGSLSSEYEDEEDEDDDDGGGGGRERRKIPDGGWGWVIVACSLVISLIADGISYSFGLLYIEFLKYFQASKSVTSWIGSLFLAVPLLSGPLCSALVDRFGCRSMTIAGATIACLGFVMSAYAYSIVMIYITFGVIAGIGLGLCYVTAVVSIAYWFDKKRSLANGLGACGSGLGTFLYAPFTQYLIYEYAWRGAVLILGGTLFNMAVCGALMREPAWFVKENRGSSVATKSRAGSSRNSVSDPDFPGVEELKKMLKSGTTPPYNPISRKTSILNGDPLSPSFQSVINLPTFLRQHEKVPVEVLDTLKTNQPMFSAILETYPTLSLSRSMSDQWGLTDSKSGSPGWRRSARRTVPNSPEQAKLQPRQNTAPNSPLLRQFESIKRKRPPQPLQGYLKNIRVRRNSVMYRGAMLNIKKYRLKASSCPDIFRNSMTTLAKENDQSWRKELMDLCHDMADFSMFLDLHFLLVSVATMLVYTYYIVPYFYLAEFMIREGYTDTDGSNALAVIGITTMFGMVGLGWLGDKPWVSVSKAFSVCLLGTGILTIAMPLFMHHYYALMAVSSGFGLFFSSVYSFTPPLIVEIIPLDRFTTAYGLSLLCQGIGNLIGPPIAGWIYDVTQTWHLSFYLAGVGLIFSCFLVALIPYTENRRLCLPTTISKDKHTIA